MIPPKKIYSMILFNKQGHIRPYLLANVAISQSKMEPMTSQLEDHIPTWTKASVYLTTLSVPDNKEIKGYRFFFK